MRTARLNPLRRGATGVWRRNEAGSGSTVILACRCICFALPGFMGRGGISSSMSGMAAPNASSSRGRCSAAFMWRISRGCLRPQSQSQIRAGPIMSATTSPARRRRWWNLRLICWACRCRRKFRLSRQSFRPWPKVFMRNSKRVSNKRIKTELGYRLIYPNYRDGLRALMSTLTA